MSKKPENTKKSATLTQAELSEVKKRVSRVSNLVQNSATAWLDVAKEFGEVKYNPKLKPRVYQRFVNDAGFTLSVADKLSLIFACKPLREKAYAEVVCRTDGWSTLYELTKLHNNKKLEEVLEFVKRSPSEKVTRRVLQNISAEKSATEKMLRLLEVVASESAIKALSSETKKTLNDVLSKARSLLSSASSFVVIRENTKPVVDALGGGKSPQPSAKSENLAGIAATAQALAHVHETELSKLAPTVVSEAERRALNVAAFQFNIFQSNARRDETIAEIAKLKATDKLDDYEKKTLKRLEASVASGSVTKMPYDPKSEVSIEHPSHRFSVNPDSSNHWNFERFFTYIRENNIMLELDGIPDRSEYAKASCAAFGETALTGTPAERKASKKVLLDIVAGEKRAQARGNVSKAPHAREVLTQINGAMSQ